MIAELDSTLNAGLTFGNRPVRRVPTDTGRQSTPGRKPWHCPVPTLEGLPRFSSTRPVPIEDELALRADSDEPGAETCAAPRGGAATADGDDDFLLRLYLRDVSREPRLAPDEELELGWRCSFGDDAARQRLVLGTLRLVVHIAFEYRGLGVPLGDLINEGNLGLWRATEGFKPTHGLRFSDYGGVWVRQRMRRALSSQARPMRLPANFSWQHSRVREAEARLREMLGFEPEDGDVAAECGFSLATVHRLRSAGFPKCLSLESPSPNDEIGQTLADLLPDECASPPDDHLARVDDQQLAHRLIATLGSREQQVLRLRFGVEDGRERTLEEVGRALGYVRQRIHQIESAALVKLRRRAAGLVSSCSVSDSGENNGLVEHRPAAVARQKSTSRKPRSDSRSSQRWSRKATANASGGSR